MANLLATAGSNSTTSINMALVQYTVAGITGHGVDILELANIDIPLYKADLEKAAGIPHSITGIYDRLRKAGGLIISVNEHNGNPSAFTKNLIDWLSRKDRQFMDGIPVLLMSASPGKRGALSSREVTASMFRRFGANVVAEFSLPSFNEVFAVGNGISNPDLLQEHKAAVARFLEAV